MFRRFATALLVVLTAASLAGQQPPAARERPDAQAPPVTFRSEVNFVEVDAIVRDAKGNAVRDLKQDELEVLEDGVPQKTTAFSYVDIPVVAPDRPLYLPREVEPDVRSNAEGPAGRIYVLLLDDLHTSAQYSGRVKQLAKDFIERNVGTNDLVTVLHTSGRADASQDFTSSRRLLSEAVDRFLGQKLRSALVNKLKLYNANNWSGYTNSATTLSDADQTERLHRARNLLDTLKSLADWLGTIHGRRKAVILVGEGIDYDIGGMSPSATASSSWANAGSVSDGASSQTSYSTENARGASGNRGDGLSLLVDVKEAVAAATRANVTIYGIDPRGVASPDDEMMAVLGAIPDNQSLGIGFNDLAREVQRGQDSLRVLAGETGGFASVTSNDFGGAFQRIVEENSSYYMLGYHPTNEQRDGRIRRIEVRVKRPGTYEVKARKGYQAPTSAPSKLRKVDATVGTSPELREALDNPVQTSDLRFSVFAAPFRAERKKAVVAIVSQFDGRDIAFRPAGTQYANALEISYVAVDEAGKVAGGDRKRVDLSLTPQTWQRVVQSGFRMQTQLELKPGRYTLRIAAREAGGRMGSVHYDLLVPDLDSTFLGMGGLVLTSRAATDALTAGTIPGLPSTLPAPPTTARTFRAGDELTVLAQICDRVARPAHKLHVATRLLAEDGRTVFSSTESQASEDLPDAKDGYWHAATVPLKDLSPGLYVLRVEAKLNMRRVDGVGREVQIRVVP